MLRKFFKAPRFVFIVVTCALLGGCVSVSSKIERARLDCNVRGQLFCFGIENQYDYRATAYFGADYNQYAYFLIKADGLGDEFIGSITEGFHGYEYFYGEHELKAEIFDGEAVKTYTARIDGKLHKIIHRDSKRLGAATSNTLRIIVSTHDPMYEKMLLGTLKLCSVDGGSQFC